MSFWKRQYKVIFPEIGYEFANTLRVKFTVEKDLTKQTNKSSLEIYNLSDTTRKALEKPDIKCEILAGYEGNGGVTKLFIGNVIQAYSKINGLDIITKFDLSDGQVAIRDSIMSISFPPNTPGDTIINAIARNMGLSIVFGEGATFGTFKNGYSFIGKGAEALSEICYGSGCTWSIQNNILQIILDGGIVANRGIVFSADSGLIGSPERIVKSNYKTDKETPKRKRKRKENKDRAEKQAGWKIKTLLSPSINPGDAVKIESKFITGWFRVEAIRHTGDINSNEWYSEIDLIERLTYI